MLGVFGDVGASTGNAQQKSPAKAAEFSVESPLKDISTFADFRQKNVTTDNLQEQNNVIRADAAYKAAKTAESASKTAKTSQDTQQANDLHAGSLQVQQSQMRHLEQKSIGNDIDNNIKDQTQAAEIKRINIAAQLAQATLQGKNLQNSLLNFEKQLNKAGVSKNDPLYIRILHKQGKSLLQGAKKIYRDAQGSYLYPNRQKY